MQFPHATMKTVIRQRGVRLIWVIFGRIYQNVRFLMLRLAWFCKRIANSDHTAWTSRLNLRFRSAHMLKCIFFAWSGWYCLCYRKHVINNIVWTKDENTMSPVRPKGVFWACAKKLIKIVSKRYFYSLPHSTNIQYFYKQTAKECMHIFI